MDQSSLVLKSTNPALVSSGGQAAIEFSVNQVGRFRLYVCSTSGDDVRGVSTGVIQVSAWGGGRVTGKRGREALADASALNVPASPDALSVISALHGTLLQLQSTVDGILALVHRQDTRLRDLEGALRERGVHGALAGGDAGGAAATLYAGGGVAGGPPHSQSVFGSMKWEGGGFVGGAGGFHESYPISAVPGLAAAPSVVESGGAVAGPATAHHRRPSGVGAGGSAPAGHRGGDDGGRNDAGASSTSGLGIPRGPPGTYLDGVPAAAINPFAKGIAVAAVAVAGDAIGAGAPSLHLTQHHHHAHHQYTNTNAFSMNSSTGGSVDGSSSSGMAADAAAIAASVAASAAAVAAARPAAAGGNGGPAAAFSSRIIGTNNASALHQGHAPPLGELRHHAASTSVGDAPASPPMVAPSPSSHLNYHHHHHLPPPAYDGSRGMSVGSPSLSRLESAGMMMMGGNAGQHAYVHPLHGSMSVGGGGGHFPTFPPVTGASTDES